MDFAITTIDNPFDPKTQFEEWNAFDIGKGYNTCAYLGRIARTSDDLSDETNALLLEEAIDEIIKINGPGLYKKINYSQLQNR